MKFHLVKLLLFLSLAASFMLLLKEDISPVRMPAARNRAGNDNGLCEYNASATKPLQSIRPAREELLAAQQEPGKAWPRHGEWPRLCCCHGRWRCSTPFGSPSAWAVMHSREWPAREESAGSAHTSGGSERPNVLIDLGFVTPDPWSLGFLESLQYPRPHRISPWGAENLWDCLVSEHGLVFSGLICKLSLTKIQQHNLPGTGRFVLGLTTPVGQISENVGKCPLGN